VFCVVGALHNLTLRILQSKRPTIAGQLKLVAADLFHKAYTSSPQTLDTKDSTHAVTVTSVLVSREEYQRFAAFGGTCRRQLQGRYDDNVHIKGKVTPLQARMWPRGG